MTEPGRAEVKVPDDDDDDDDLDSPTPSPTPRPTKTQTSCSDFKESPSRKKVMLAEKLKFHNKLNSLQNF